jgi:hypothetical protein
MPQIIVTTDEPGDRGVTWRERISTSDLESGHFSEQLLERLRWAVGDAHTASTRRPLSKRSRETHQRPAPVRSAIV